MKRLPATTRRWFVTSVILVIGLAVSAIFLISQNQPVAAFPGIATQSITNTTKSSATEFTPTQTLTATATPFQPLPTSTPTSTPLPTNTPAPTKKPELPEEACVEGVRGTFQIYPLSCEASSAVDFAAFFGTEISEIDFQNSLPKSDDPDEGFVGSVYGYPGQIPPYPYGVHAEPVAKLLRSYSLKAYAQKELSFSAVKREIAAGRPVIVWVVGAIQPGYPVSYTASNGHTTDVVYNEHVALIIGYTQNSVVVLDGALLYERSIPEFKNSWAVLNNQAITRKENP